MRRKLVGLVFWIALPLAAGFLGSIPTTANLDWYRGLNTPSFAPPEWVFGPVWTLLNILMGIAAYLVWSLNPRTPGRRRALVLFVIHLLFYVLWSVLFFGLQAPFPAMVDILILLSLIATLCVLFFRLRRSAGFLLLPYLAWVAFASVLNGAYVLLNRASA